MGGNIQVVPATSETSVSASIAGNAELNCRVFTYGKTIAGFGDSRSC
jgi:hypothetical protein